MKNLKKVSVVLMLALGTTFAMTSCGGGMTEAEAEAAAAEMLEGLDAAMDDVEAEVEEMKCEEGKCGDAMDADSTATGEEAEATCEGGEATEEAAH